MDISKITDTLYVSSKLQVEHIEELPARNIHLAISMIIGQPPPDFSNHACRILWLQTCDSIFIPIPMKELMIGVHTALPVIQSGHSVIVYCAKGRHRSIAMAASILIAMGHTAREAMGLLSAQRTVADPQAWHISRRIYKFERYWKNRTNQRTHPIDHIEEIYAETATNILHYFSELGRWTIGKVHHQQMKSHILKEGKTAIKTHPFVQAILR